MNARPLQHGLRWERIAQFHTHEHLIEETGSRGEQIAPHPSGSHYSWYELSPMNHAEATYRTTTYIRAPVV